MIPQKDMPGSRLTVGLSKASKKTGMLDRSRATIERVIEYCKVDVDCEEYALGRLGDLSSAERKIWELDQTINQRGILLDLDYVRQALLVVERASKPLLQEFRDLTGGIDPGQVAKVIEWAAGRGVALESLQAAYIDELLGMEEDDEEELSAEGEAYPTVPRQQDLPDGVRRMLAIRRMLGSASIKKLARMQLSVCDDGRARGLLQYHAAHPGRWGGRLFQPHNFPRGGLVDELGNKVPIDTVHAAIMSGDPARCSVYFKKNLAGMLTRVEAIECVAFSLRHALIAGPGKKFMAGDYAGIEMRVNLALAGQHDKCELLDDPEVDVYLDMAHLIYDAPPGTIKKDDVARRTIGKSTVLGCGFQMGGPKFNMRYCPDQSPEFAAGVVRTYRERWAPKVPVMWRAFKYAVEDVIGRKRDTVTVYGCTFRMDGEFMRIDLPSGWQTLWFYQAKMRLRINLVTKAESWQPSYKVTKDGKWETVFLYGGILCENIVQALARGILCEAMGRLEYQEKMPLVLSVHDEALAEVPEDTDIKRFVSCMEQRSDWIARMGVPISVETWEGPCYKK
jgi:DNA polymerase